MNKIIDRLNVLAGRHERFIFDLRGNCLVYTGVIAAYDGALSNALQGDPSAAILHALDHDGIVGAWKEGGSSRSRFASCRLFTDQASALRFAKQQQQPTVFNLNRDLEVQVDPVPAFVQTTVLDIPPALWTERNSRPVLQSM